MAKLYENSYIEMVQKKILGNDFTTKDDLIQFLNKIRMSVLQDSFWQQYFHESFITLNEETLNQMNKYLLEYYDKRKNNDLMGLNLEGVSSFAKGDDGQNYIKYQDAAGNIVVMDDSLDDNGFVEQFQERQNELSSAQTNNSDENKKAILEDMQKDKRVVIFASSLNVNTRELTLEERTKFAAAMNISDAGVDNFLVSVEDNLYINKDTGEVYYVKKNSDGKWEVRKANEVDSKTSTEEMEVIDDSGKETTMSYETPEEADYEAMSDSDLEYILETKKEILSLEIYEKIKSILQKRKEKALEEPQRQLDKDKVYVKKLEDVGFISIILLSTLVSSFGIGLLLLVISRI